MIAYPGAKHNSKLQPSAAQIPPGDAGRIITDLLRGAAGHDPPAGISAAGAHVDDVVRIADDVQVMLDDHHSRTIVQQGLEHPQQHLHIQRVQADGRLVKDEHRVALGLAHLAGHAEEAGCAAVKAIRDDEIAASASGINITYMKVLVFAISAFFAGIAGGIFAQYIGSLNPAMAGWLQSINYVIMVVFGGMGSLTGSIVSAIALTILPELLRAFSTYRMLVYSVALVLIMIFRPQGIFGNWEFSLTKTINKLFYPMKVKAHGKSKQAESTAKAVKDTAKTDETVETAADTKEAQA